MTEIHLDASRWAEPRDLYDDLLPALGAPGWHGRNLDALWDGLTGGLYALESPLTVFVANPAASALGRSGYLAKVARVFAEARAERGIDCTLRME